MQVIQKQYDGNLNISDGWNYPGNMLYYRKRKNVHIKGERKLVR